MSFKSLLLCAILAISGHQVAFAIGPKVLSSTVLLTLKKAPDFKKIAQASAKSWGLKTDSINISDKTLVFSTPNATVMVAYLDYAVPVADIKTAATLNWMWKTAAESTIKHQGQIVVSVIGNSGKALELYKTLTKAVATVLENNDCLGVYVESQYLLLSKDYYLSAARNMVSTNTLPLYCWIYFGIYDSAGGKNGYTFGLQELGIPELEILNSQHSLQEVHAAIYDAALGIIYYNAPPKDGKNIVTMEGSELTFSRSKSAILEGETVKIDY